MDNPIDLLVSAVEDSAPNYLQVEASDLSRPTPCEGWDLRALLNHVMSRFVISTNAARMVPTSDFGSVELDYMAGDPAVTFTELSTEMLEAWRSCSDMTTDRVTPLGSVPPGGVLLFGAQDVFIHAWDVAKTRGVSPVLSEAMVEVFTETHKQSVDAQTREIFFAGEVEVASNATPLDGLVAFLGREPSWGVKGESVSTD